MGEVKYVKWVILDIQLKWIKQDSVRYTLGENSEIIKKNPTWNLKGNYKNPPFYSSMISHR